MANRNQVQIDPINNTIIVSQPITETVKIATIGPQGPVGPVGPQGPSGSLVLSGSIDNDVIITGSVEILGSLTITGSVNGEFTGSLLGTASNAVSASFSQTASYVNPLTQDVQITGSVDVSGSFINNGLTYPLVDGESGRVIVTDGNGNLTLGDGERLVLEVRNDSGAEITVGCPVYSKGEIGGSNRILVDKADASDPTKMPAIGVLQQTLNTTDNKDGFAVVTGILNTNIPGFTGLTEGQIVYVKGGGDLTSTKPTGSDLIQNVGIILKTNGTVIQGLKVSAIGRANDVPNITPGYTWVGNADGVATPTPTSSIAPSYTNSTPTPIDFPSSDDPNIPAGTTFLNKTFTEMMDLMLYPELFPTLTNPSNTFTMSPSGLREIGEDISTITLNASFNRGSISPAYGTSGFRSGLPNTYVYTGTGTSNNSSTSLTDTEIVSPYTVLSGVQSWTGAVSYDAGEQPLSSKGNNYNSPLPAGTTSAITRTITGVYPVFATTSAINTLTKQSLQTMTTYIQVSMVAENDAGDKQTIDIPNAWSTITGLQQFNILSGAWDTINLSTFTTSATTQTIQGNIVNYTKYTHNGSKIGARQLRFIV